MWTQKHTSISNSPDKTGLKAKDPWNDSLGRYCENSAECGIFFHANLYLMEAKCLLRTSDRMLDQSDAIMI